MNKNKCKICGMETSSNGYYYIKDDEGYEERQVVSCCSVCGGKYGNRIQEALKLGTYGKHKVILEMRNVKE